MSHDHLSIRRTTGHQHYWQRLLKDKVSIESTSQTHVLQNERRKNTKIQRKTRSFLTARYEW